MAKKQAPAKKSVKKAATKKAAGKRVKAKKAATQASKKVAAAPARKAVALPTITGNLNVKGLVDTIAAKASISRNEARTALNATLESIQTHVSKGKKVVLAGFGSFERTSRKARVGRNPQTGEPVQIKASKLPKFRPGKIFKDAVR